jgi:hypothetical protein
MIMTSVESKGGHGVEVTQGGQRICAEAQEDPHNAKLTEEVN